MTDTQKQIITVAYANGTSPTEIGRQLGLTRGAVKEYLRRTRQIRSQSTAAKLAAQQGRKDKAVVALRRVNCVGGTNQFNPEKCPWRGTPSKHPRWIADRTKLKQHRMACEEKTFMREVRQEHNYTCSLTGQVGGKLSVHHVFPVWKYGHRRLDKTAVAVIRHDIHHTFHARYGWKADEHDWAKFIAEEGYDAVCEPQTTKSVLR